MKDTAPHAALLHCSWVLSITLLATACGVSPPQVNPLAATPYPAIGQLVVDDGADRRWCTATLVAPDRVLTAAACVLLDSVPVLQTVAPEQVQFVAADPLRSQRRAVQVLVHPEFQDLRSCYRVPRDGCGAFLRDCPSPAEGDRGPLPEICTARLARRDHDLAVVQLQSPIPDLQLARLSLVQLHVDLVEESMWTVGRGAGPQHRAAWGLQQILAVGPHLLHTLSQAMRLLGPGDTGAPLFNVDPATTDTATVHAVYSGLAEGDTALFTRLDRHGDFLTGAIQP